MQTEAVFENIAERIQQEISKAQKSIFIAVAWFTKKNSVDKDVSEAHLELKIICHLKYQ